MPRSCWTKLRPAGRIAFVAEVHDFPQHQQPDIAVTVQPLGASMFADFFPYTITDVYGTTTYTYVTGATSSPDFPLVNALQTAPAGLGGPIFKSTSAGSSWNEASSGIPSPVAKIVINPQNPSTLYAVSYPCPGRSVPASVQKQLALCAR